MALEAESAYLKLNFDTVERIRKDYNLDKPGAMDQAIDILHNWTQKQAHFVKKDFPRGYLERFIISSKGSVEKAKVKMDKLCTMRTMVPNLFVEKSHAINDFPGLKDYFITLIMPIMCEDNCRIQIGKLMTKNVSAAAWLAAYQHSVIICEYAKVYDYAQSYYVVYDLGDVNIMDLIANLNIVDLRNTLVAIMEAYGFRIKKVFLISPSKMINAFVKILKQCVSAKIAERIVVLQSPESVLEYLPKQYLPKEYGGDQKSILDLYDELNVALSSEKHVAHIKKIRQACTNEALRSSDRFNNECLGMPGSFKLLSID